MQTVLTLTMNPAVDMSCTADTVTPDRKLRSCKVRRVPGGGTPLTPV
jgi:fructose-1-phosphate kinase PfkB-like protein